MYFSMKKLYFLQSVGKFSLESPWLPYLCEEQEGMRTGRWGAESRQDGALSDQWWAGQSRCLPFRFTASAWHVMPALSFTTRPPATQPRQKSWLPFSKEELESWKPQVPGLSAPWAKSLTYICLVSKTGTLLGSLRGEWAFVGHPVP